MPTLPTPPDASKLPLQQTIEEIGHRLFGLMDTSPRPLFSKKGLWSRLMEWSMRDEAFKAQLFRFVDALPSLRSSGEIVRHLKEYLGDQAVELSRAMKGGLAAYSRHEPSVLGTSRATFQRLGDRPRHLPASWGQAAPPRWNVCLMSLRSVVPTRSASRRRHLLAHQHRPLSPAEGRSESQP
jgi:hypothetical protein